MKYMVMLMLLVCNLSFADTSLSTSEKVACWNYVVRYINNIKTHDEEQAAIITKRVEYMPACVAKDYLAHLGDNSFNPGDTSALNEAIRTAVKKQGVR